MINLSIENGIATITLNRPEKLNALSGTMREDLLRALRQAGDDTTCRVVVITGAGRAFCAVGDVEFIPGLPHRPHSYAFRQLFLAPLIIVTLPSTLPLTANS